MKTLHNVAFVLESGQELWFHAKDFLEFDFQAGGEIAIKVGDEIVSVPVLNFVTAAIDAGANHTYPIQGFSTPSKNTNFTELLEAYDLAVVLLEDDEEAKPYFIVAEASVCTELDKFGNLHIAIDSNSEAPIEPPALPF